MTHSTLTQPKSLWARISLTVRCCLIIILALKSIATANAGTFVDRIVVRTSQAAPGAPGSTFSFVEFGSISGPGSITFRASLAGGSASQGIWLEQNEDLGLIALSGQPSAEPGFSWTTVEREPNIGDGPTVGVAWTVRDDLSGGTADGLWVATGSSDFAKIALQGQATPAPDTQYGPFLNGLSNEYIRINTLGQTLFRNRVSGNVTNNNDDILAFFDGQKVDIVARESQPVSGGGSFGATVGSSPFTMGPIGMAISPSGTAVFTATIATADGSGGTAFRPGVFKYANGNLTKLAASGDVCPGVGGDCVLGAIGAVHINGAEQIAIQASQDYPGEGRSVPSIFLSDGFDNFTVAYANPDSGETGIVCCISPLFVLQENGDIIVEGTASGNTALLRISGGSGSTLLEAGQQAPQLPPGVVFSQFRVIHGNRTGQLAFLARLTGPGVTNANNEAIFAGLAPDTLGLVVRRGDELEIAPGDFRVVERASLRLSAGPAEGKPRSLSDTGEVLWQASLADNSRALVTSFIGLPPAPPPTLVALEAVQVVQDWTNSAALIANRKTMVRAHLRSELNEPVDVRLRGFNALNNSELAGSPLLPMNPGGFVNIGPDSDMARGNPWASALFTLPPDPAWRSGEVDIVVESANTGLICEEVAGVVENDCTAELTFINSAEPQLKIISVNWDKNGDLQRVGEGLRQQLANRVLSAFPISALDWTSRSVNWRGAGRPDTKDVLIWMRRVRAWDGCSSADGCNRLYYGALLGNVVDGIAYLDGVEGVGFVPPSPKAEGRHTHTHELAHNLSRRHAVHSSFGVNANGSKRGVCGSKGAADVPDFPFLFEVNGQQRQTLGPMDQGENSVAWGFDTIFQQPVDPSQYFELMSYCSNAPLDFWPSLFTYEALRVAINERFGPVEQAQKIASANHMMVSGVINLVSGSVQLDPVSLLPSAVAPASLPTGNWTLEFLDQSGVVLQSVGFQPDEMEARGDDPGRASFLIGVPMNNAIRRIELYQDANLMAQTQASSNAPTVNLISPVGAEIFAQDDVVLQWSASDLDGDALSYIVQYSADGGTNWITSAVDWPSTTYTLPRSAFSATGDGRIRVIVTDGFLTAVAESPAGFTVVNNPPFVQIDSPTAGQLFFPSQTIDLTASGFDPEDGPLEDSAINWVSDIDGGLGSGTEVQLLGQNLSPGDHLVTAMTVDSEGADALAQVMISIVETVPPNLSDLQVSLSGPGVDASINELNALVVVVANGPASANDLSMSIDASGAVAQLLSMTVPTGWACSNSLPANCSTSGMSHLSEARFTLRLRASSFDEITVTADVQGAGVDPIPANNSSDVVLFAPLDLLFVNGFE